MTTPAPQGIRTETDGDILIVTIDRPPARNAVDRPTADALYETFKAFDADDTLSVAILTGANGNFCAGRRPEGRCRGTGEQIRDPMVITDRWARPGWSSPSP
jgi:enoyl-CoA hydratase